MGYVKRITVTLVVMFIASCSSAQPPAPAKTLVELETLQLDRAREVQKTIDDNAERTRKALENQERGERP